MEQYKDIFLEETFEILLKLEECLLELEETPDDGEIISEAFRCMHTVKGNSAMFGFDSIAEFTHEIEPVFSDLRDGSLVVSKQLIDLLFVVIDHIRYLLDCPVLSKKEVDVKSDSIVRDIKKITVDCAVPEIIEVPDKNGNMNRDLSHGEEFTYRIKFVPSSDIFYSGTNPLLLLGELSDLGDYSCVCHTQNIPALSLLDAERCYIFWDIVLTTSSAIDTLHDVFVFVDGSSEINIERIDGSVSFLKDSEEIRIGDILVKRGVIEDESIEEVLHSQKRIGELLIDKQMISAPELDIALKEQKHLRKADVKRKNRIVNSKIGVSTKRLDTLMDLVGELITAQAQLIQTSLHINDDNLLLVTEKIDKLTSEIRDNTMGLRMMPIGTTFNRFKRLVRDLSGELGKKIELVTEGGETEIDNAVLDKLNDPLVHIIRNAIDHGIESSEDRRKAGKSDTGSIKITAWQSSAYILIGVEDDGAGLDREAIITRAVSRGLVQKESRLSDEDIFQLIFENGFSTSKEITEVSGRGVGMDVVRKDIESLQGSVSIESTEGKGTNVTLKLPLTLAIIDGLLVSAGGQLFVVPLSSVEECIEFNELEQNSNMTITTVRDYLIPYRSLLDFFKLDSAGNENRKLIVTRMINTKFGIIVDRIIGDIQAVIKPLGRFYQNVEGISGATILGDGRVALILDINEITMGSDCPAESIV